MILQVGWCETWWAFSAKMAIFTILNDEQMSNWVEFKKQNPEVFADSNKVMIFIPHRINVSYICIYTHTHTYI